MKTAILAAVAFLLAMNGSTFAAFNTTTGNSGNTFSAAADLTAPTASATTGARSDGGGTAGQIRQGAGYYLYANVSDTGNPASGVATVTADVSAFDTGITAASLTTTGGPWTVGGTSYSYRTSLLTSDTGLTTGASYSYSLTMADVAGNSRTTTGFTVTIETYSSVISATSGLVSWWRLGETTGTTAADSKGTNNGTYTGGYTLGATGALAGDSNKAVTLNGSTGYVNIGNPTNLQLTTGSEEAWFKTSNAGTGYRVIMDKYLAYNILLNNNVLEVFDYGANADRSTGINVADGAWHHVVVTFQSGVSNGTKVYLDGALVLTTTMTVSSNANVLRLGYTAAGGTYFFTGTLDELATYNTVLSASTVLDHAESGFGSDDNTAPAVVRTIGARSDGGGTAGQVRQGVGYYIYAQVTDPSPTSGISSVTANTSSFDTGVTAATLTTTGGPWTVGGQSYNYRTSVQTADTPLTTGATYSYSITTTDGAGNTATSSGNTVTIETYSSVVNATSGLIDYWRFDDSNTSAATSDTFTGTAGTTLQSHTADSGATWTKTSGTIDGVISSSNTLRRATSSTGGVSYQASTVPSSANYAVQADVVVKSLLSTDAIGVFGRQSGTADSYYLAQVVRTSGGTPQWEVDSVSAGTTTSLGTSTLPSITAGSTYTLKLVIQGSSISLWVNGSLVIGPVINTTWTAAGHAGVRLGSGTAVTGTTDAAGLHLDNYTMTVLPTAADSKGSNSGAYDTGITTGASGALAGDSDGAVTFGGSSGYMQVPSPTGLPTGASARSVELWFKTSSSSQQTLFDYGSLSSAQEFGLLITNSTTLTAWNFGTDFTFTAGSSFANGAWHHVVETYDGSSIRVYLDGSQLGTAQAITESTTLNSYGFQVGSVLTTGNTNSGHFFSGSLDEVAVYNVALSSTTISDHYHSGHGS